MARKEQLRKEGKDGEEMKLGKKGKDGEERTARKGRERWRGYDGKES